MPLINLQPNTKSSKLKQLVSDSLHYFFFGNSSSHPRLFLGDCYVAVTGLPKPQERHALLMARFAWDCLLKFEELTMELETTLGPDTTELGIRFGMHSGPVTAGVLRGDRARFQLFGDTVNTGK